MGCSIGKTKETIILEDSASTVDRKLLFFNQPSLQFFLQKKLKGYKTFLKEKIESLNIQDEQADLAKIVMFEISNFKQLSITKYQFEFRTIIVEIERYLTETYQKLSDFRRNAQFESLNNELQLIDIETIQFCLELLIVINCWKNGNIKKQGENFWEQTYYYERKLQIYKAYHKISNTYLDIEEDLQNFILKGNVIFAPLFEMALFLKYLGMYLSFFHVQPSFDIQSSLYSQQQWKESITNQTANKTIKKSTFLMQGSQSHRTSVICKSIKFDPKMDPIIEERERNQSFMSVKNEYPSDGIKVIDQIKKNIQYTVKFNRHFSP